MWECHGAVLSVSGHFMEPLLESDVGNGERCSRQEVALRRHEVQQARSTLINDIAGTCVGRSVRRAALADVFKVADTSRVLACGHLCNNAHGDEKRAFTKGQRHAQGCISLQKGTSAWEEEPTLKRSPVRGVTKVSVKGEIVQD